MLGILHIESKQTGNQEIRTMPGGVRFGHSGFAPQAPRAPKRGTSRGDGFDSGFAARTFGYGLRVSSFRPRARGACHGVAEGEAGDLALPVGDADLTKCVQ